MCRICQDSGCGRVGAITGEGYAWRRLEFSGSITDDVNDLERGSFVLSTKSWLFTRTELQ